MKIKFRVFFYDGVDYSTGEIMSGVTAFRENYIDFDGDELNPVDECSILMQFTGMTDKNGKEIYAGDILRSYDGEDARICEVYYNEVAAMFRVCYAPHDFDSPLCDFLSIANGRASIIGNIYENPELIKEQ